MAKRFTDTTKWDRAWFRRLEPRLKCAWFFILDKCDNAGLWPIDMESLAHYVGAVVTIDEIKQNFKTRDVGKHKLFVEGFIEFQYKCDPESLNPDNKAHESVIKTLRRAGILKGLARGLDAPVKGAKEKEEDKEKEQERGSVRGKLNLAKSELHRIAVLWNEHRGPLPLVKEMNPTRTKRCRDQDHRTDEEIVQAIRNLLANPWNLGKNDRGWRADFDYFLRPDKLTAAVEGSQLPNGGGNHQRTLAVEW